MRSQKIPKIIHQIWSGIDEPLPNHFKLLGDTWKRDYPDWQYILWNQQSMNQFLETHYPEYMDIYNRFPYNVQRWDAIRYLILYKMGGIYADFDYESIKPIDRLIENKSCGFAEEPPLHVERFHKKVKQVFNNALMFSMPENTFMQKVIHAVFNEETLNYNSAKEWCVLNTTGPWKLIDLYYEITDKDREDIYLIPAKFVTPFSYDHARTFLRNIKNKDLKILKELEPFLSEAYAVHYFFSGWRRDET